MKAMVLAAGLGTRMHPLSLLRAKPALPVLNRPLILWTLELLARHGVSEVVINLHHRPDTVRDAVGERPSGLRVTWSYEPEILGTAGGPRRVRDFLGDDPFLLVNGDVVFDFDLTALVRRHRESGARATLALLPNPDPEAYGGIVVGRDGWVRAVADRPRPVPGVRWLFAGVHVLDPALLGRLPPGPSDSVRDLYPWLVSERAVRGERVKGAWYDLGSPWRYRSAQAAMLASGFRGATGPALVHPTARLGRGVRLRRAVVGPGSRLGDGVSLTDTVLWDGVRVGAGARLRECVLTSGTSAAAGAIERRVLLMRTGGRQRRTGLPR
jgi:NDP-sugar pyrophosphorylase family protein